MGLSIKSENKLGGPTKVILSKGKGDWQKKILCYRMGFYLMSNPRVIFSGPTYFKVPDG